MTPSQFMSLYLSEWEHIALRLEREPDSISSLLSMFCCSTCRISLSSALEFETLMSVGACYGCMI